jgi:NADPH:quinone reductase
VNAAVPDTMRAVVLRGPGGVEALEARSLPVPVPERGWVLMRVRAVGLNRSELHTRLGLAEGVTFPRVPGIEATGEVIACPGGEFADGQRVMTMMGGMGRTFDGGYAEYTCVPAGQVIPFRSDLPWELVGAVPEMLQTAYGSLTTGLDARPGQSLLVRGGTSSVGMAAAVLAKRQGLTVVSTTRSSAKAERLHEIGVDHVIIDDGAVAPQVRQLVPGGVDLALELVGAPTLRDTLRTLRIHGVACFTGMLSNSWVVEDFYPIDYIPTGVRLTAYSGEATDLPGEVLQDYLDSAAQDHRLIPLDRVFSLDQIGAAHEYMEQDRATGKIVVIP